MADLVKEKVMMVEALTDIGEVETIDLQKLIIKRGVIPKPIKVTVDPVEDVEDHIPGEIIRDPAGKLLKRYLTYTGLSGFLIDIYDDWIMNRLEGQITSKKMYFDDGKYIAFENVRYSQPTYDDRNRKRRLLPHKARRDHLTYAMNLSADVVMYDAKGYEMDRMNNPPASLGSIPLMLGSQACYLHKKTDVERVGMGEMAKDPLGYFIIRGTEKVVLLQEQLRINRIFLFNQNSKSSVVCRMTVGTERGTALMELAIGKRGAIKFRMPSFGKNKKKKSRSIGVLQIFRYFGMFGDRQEGDPDYTDIDVVKATISQYLSDESRKKSLLKLTASEVKLYTTNSRYHDDVEYMVNKLTVKENPKYKGKRTCKVNLKNATREVQEQCVRDAFENDFFPNLNDKNYKDKIKMLSVMIARLLEHMAGYRKIDDRDSWGNKRLNSAGWMMEQLFRGHFRVITKAVQDDIDKGSIGDLGGFRSRWKPTKITEGFADSFITPNWGVKGVYTKPNVAQTLKRDNIISAISHLHRVDVGIERNDKQPNLRLIQNSQWGYIDPVETPEGEGCGILKNLALTAKITMDVDDHAIIYNLTHDNMYGPEKTPERTTMLLINGKPYGWCSGARTKQYCIEKRRSLTFSPHTCIVLDLDNCLNIHTDTSRVIRPLLIVGENGLLEMDNMGLRGSDMKTLLGSGCLEFIDAWEQEYIKLATSTNALELRIANLLEASEAHTQALADLEAVRADQEIPVEFIKDDELQQDILTEEAAKQEVLNTERVLREITKPYTHCEIDPQAILGVSSSLIPHPENEQAPRNTYQASMGKQALGTYHSNHLNRFDGKTKLLAWPSRPTFETQMSDLVGNNELPQGQQVVVAFSSITGFTQEDAFLFRRGAIEQGKFRMFKYITYKTVFKDNTGSITETLGRPEISPDDKISSHRYRHINDNGLPTIGAYLRQGDAITGKIQTILDTGVKENKSTLIKVGDEGYVEDVYKTTESNNTVVLIKLRIMRIPTEGDKFAPRYAQKGTIGLIVDDEDMPYGEDTGVIPDVVVNPHALPSRMTIGYVLELFSGKHSAMRGERIDATAFRPFDFDSARRTMREYGFNETGKENLVSGITGEVMGSQTYVGPAYVQALKHHVADKFQARNMGAVKTMTHQPTRGRASGGGLRFGEMERDAAISHGASAFLRERLCLVSDPLPAVFCKTCGTFAVTDYTTGTHKCRWCGDKGNFGRTTIPYAYKLLTHLLAIPAISLRFKMVTAEEYKRRGVQQIDVVDLDEMIEEDDEEDGDEEMEDMDLDEANLDFADAE